MEPTAPGNDRDRAVENVMWHCRHILQPPSPRRGCYCLHRPSLMSERGLCARHEREATSADERAAYEAEREEARALARRAEERTT